MASINYESILKKIEEVSVIDTDTIYLVSKDKSECPNCEIDPITGYTRNTFCFVCGGKGYVIEEKRLEVLANVDYITGMESALDRGGKFEKGTVVITIHEKQLAMHDLTVNNIKDVVSFVEIKGLRYTINHLTPQYLQGILYEVIIELGLYKEKS